MSLLIYRLVNESSFINCRAERAEQAKQATRYIRPRTYHTVYHCRVKRAKQASNICTFKSGPELCSCSEILREILTNERFW